MVVKTKDSQPELEFGCEFVLQSYIKIDGKMLDGL